MSDEALDRIAEALTRIAQSVEKFYERTYPDRREVREAVVTHRLSEEEALQESLGRTGEDDPEWMGQRERLAVQGEKAKR